MAFTVCLKALNGLFKGHPVELQVNAPHEVDCSGYDGPAPLT